MSPEIAQFETLTNKAQGLADLMDYPSANPMIRAIAISNIGTRYSCTRRGINLSISKTEIFGNGSLPTMREWRRDVSLIEPTPCPGAW
jgi:hypothetical protein